MKIVRIPFALALLSFVVLAMSGLGVRLGWWPFPTGFQMLRWVVYIGLAAAVGALIGLAVPRWRAGATVVLLLAIVLGGASAWFPWHMLQTAKSLPPIHDISTDLSDPPKFIAVAPQRPAPAAYGGSAIAAQQRAGYPDIQPLLLTDTKALAFGRALSAAKQAGWEIVAADPYDGRIEAVATTLWFGFKDDIAVRVGAADGGSRIDVRSVSRVGKSDVGANAARIRAYFAAVQAEPAVRAAGSAY
jgi:uncharacterized protein (DUF1499 family)